MTSVASSATASPEMAIKEKNKIAVQLKGLWKTYPGSTIPAVRDLSLDVALAWRYGNPDDLLSDDAVEAVTVASVGLNRKGNVQSGNPSGQLAIALAGRRDCVVFGRTYNPDGIKTGESVYIGVRPEDVDIQPALAAEAPSGMIGGTARAALFIGERIEYQVEVEGQGVMMIYGERHKPVDEGGQVWLKLRPDGHSAWASDWSHKEE